MDTAINSKSVNEVLTESEFKEVKFSVESMFKMMETIMQNWSFINSALVACQSLALFII
jgi:hypothetical protein